MERPETRITMIMIQHNITNIGTAAFPLKVTWLGLSVNIEIRPYWKENGLVDYAIWSAGKLQFTITKEAVNNKWVIAMINADKQINDAFVHIIGEQIEGYFKTGAIDHTS